MRTKITNVAAHADLTEARITSAIPVDHPSRVLAKSMKRRSPANTSDLSKADSPYVCGHAIMRDHKVDSALYAQAEKTFGRTGIVELVTAMGDYVMVGMVMTAIDQHLPPDRPALLLPR